MTPITKWLVLSAAILSISFVYWWFGVGIWAGFTLYQFNLLTGQGIISAGVIVLLLEVEKQWYDDEEDGNT